MRPRPPRRQRYHQVLGLELCRCGHEQREHEERFRACLHGPPAGSRYRTRCGCTWYRAADFDHQQLQLFGPRAL